MNKTLLLLVLASVLAACAPKLQRPDLSVISVEMLNGNVLQQNFRVRLSIQNPNDRTLPVEGVQATLHVNGEQIASGVSSGAFVVPAFGQSEFDMLISANMAVGLLKIVGGMNQQTGAIDYELTGVVSMDLPWLRSLAFDQHGSFSLK
jgi:LEA14-like dessication related protein